MADQYGMTYDPGASARPYAVTDDGLPTRPYADSGQLGGNAPRTPEFNAGISGDPGSAVSSLNADSQRWRNLTPQQFERTSVLEPILSGPNGISETDHQRRALPGNHLLPTQNGQSASSWESSNYLRMQGEDAI
jgi:hypothetical protein